MLLSLLIDELHVLEVVVEHEEDRDEVPNHWQCQARDQICKIKGWRHEPVVKSASYVAEYEDKENHSDSLHALIQVVTPHLPYLSEGAVERNDCQY